MTQTRQQGKSKQTLTVGKPQAANGNGFTPAIEFDEVTSEQNVAGIRTRLKIAGEQAQQIYEANKKLIDGENAEYIATGSVTFEGKILAIAGVAGSFDFTSEAKKVQFSGFVAEEALFASNGTYVGSAVFQVAPDELVNSGLVTMHVTMSPLECSISWIDIESMSVLGSFHGSGSGSSDLSGFGGGLFSSMG